MYFLSLFIYFYHFFFSVGRFLRLQIEAFFAFVLLRISTTQGVPLQLQEVSLEGIINFCRQPTFIIEMYENYDCDPHCRNVFEEIGKLLCKHSFPVSSPLTSLKIQAFEGLMIIIHIYFLTFASLKLIPNKVNTQK